MSAENNEVNRTIDTAEGHRLRLQLEEAQDAGKRATVRPSDGADDEAEGHRKIVI